jgi:hypothetical protein
MTRFSTTLLAIALCAGTLGAAPPPMPQPGTGPSGPSGPPPPMYQPMAEPGAEPTPNPELLARAKSTFAQLQAGTVNPSQLAAGPNGAMSAQAIANAKNLVGNLGPPVSFVAQQQENSGSVSAAIYLVTFKNGEKVDFLFAVDSQGKIEGMSIGTPHQ